MKYKCLLVFILFMHCILGCNTKSFHIPNTWSFTVITKDRSPEKKFLRLSKNQRTIFIYYPEICGFCLSQADFIVKQKNNNSKKNVRKDAFNVKLYIVIGTKDIKTMQYYMDEKINSVNKIFLDTDDNIRNEFYKNKSINYPVCFIFNGMKLIKKEEINNDKSLKFIYSYF